MKLIHIISYITLLLFLTGCVRNKDYDITPDGYEVMANISIATKNTDNIYTKAVNDSHIRDVHFFIFDTDGALLHHEYVYTAKSINISLISNKTYRFYAVTNTSDPSIFNHINTETILKGQIYTLTDIEYLKDAELLLMSGKNEVTAGTGGMSQNIEIPVHRIAAKVNIHIISAIPNYEVTDIYLGNLPVNSFYCGQEEDIQDKEFYDEEIPLTLNEENKAQFYMLENRAGGRVKTENYNGDDTNQKEKRKYAPETATYIRIEGSLVDKNATYTTKHWIYLGRDNCNDYNVGRNESHRYIITIKGIEESNTDTRVDIIKEEIMLGDELDPANCYVVDKPGNFKISAKFMGNRTDQLIDIQGKDVAAEYLWTTVPEAVSNVRYNKEDSCIYFTLNPDPLTGEAYRGNTVVALYDKNTNEILWSWHLWLTETPAEVVTGGTCAPSDKDHPDEAASGHLIIMDRNLGATSANPREGWKTYGCYYQMGRKDPFIGTDQDGTLDRNGEKDTDPQGDIKKIIELESSPFGSATQHTEWNAFLAPEGWKYHTDYISAREGVRYPMTLASGKDGPWTTKGKNTNDPIFEVHGGHEDFWNRTKTINDPCPSGWTIIGRRNSSVFFDNNKDVRTYTWDTGNGIYGLTTQLPGFDKVWWPAAGSRSMLGTMSDVGYRGIYAQYDHIDNNHGAHCMYFHKDIKVPNHDTKTNHAASIRCVKVKQK